MRIGFLFNHDQIHQVAHSLPIAMSLADRGFDGDIVVATTNDRLAEEAGRIAGARLGQTIRHQPLGLSSGSRRLDALLGRALPSAKLLVYRDNLDFFRSLDMLVVAEKTSLVLKRRFGLNNLSIVHTRHGAGDRAIGFDRASAGFDHVLCSGPKIRRRLINEAGVPAERISIVGYPKFDVAAQAQATDFFAGKKTVMYNPHPSPHLSSWYRHGRAVLDQFAGDSQYGLIFAPHVMLFERNLVISIDRLAINRPGRIPDRIRQAANILVDTGSRASTDMTYTQAADIYLGDASSQIYEFLLRPRPCVFLNTHRVRWEGDPNYAHWRAGEVIDDPAALPDALARAEALHREKFRPVQEDLFADSFDLAETPSSVRAADVIEKLANLRRRSALGKDVVMPAKAEARE